jgi:hypothetical protein
MNLSTLPQDTLRAAVLKALSDEIGKAIKDGKADLKQAADTLKIKALTAELPDGTEVATITRAGGAAKPRVTDERKFLDWVLANRPGEVMQAVRESYRKALLEAVEKAGQPVDPETGDVIPGVEFETTAEYLTVRFTGGNPGGQELIKRAWRNGQVSLDSLLALPAGGDSDAA